ncbi:hypothetical protein MGSAQ_000426 [marine sediment metagenome]|uniref:Uncharacterized protein n=1 Tax=marine sediment metagenome TaxID=412755 RepID=A0A1B6NXK5_9ZZZZ
MLDHDSPPSKVTVAPPSLALIMFKLFSGFIHISWVSPWGRDLISKVLPPSMDLCSCTFITYRVFSSLGSTLMWL